MSIEITLLSNPIYIDSPQGLIGWAGWLILLGVVVYTLWQWWHYNKRWTHLQRWIFLALVILLPLTNLFLVLRLPAGQALPPPGKPVEPVGAAVVIFAALPWVLAAGFLGPAPASALGLVSGLLLALWDTHSAFTPLEMALWAALLGAAFQQRYRTFFYRLLRHPLFSAILIALLFPLLFILDTVWITGGSLPSRLDYTLARLPTAALALAIEMLVGGLVAEILALAFPTAWGGRGVLQASPFERRLQARFLSTLAPLTLLLIIALMAGDWVVAGSAARNMLHDRMESTANMAAEGVPYFMETGQNLIQQLARNNTWYQGSASEVSALLEDSLRSVPYFRELYVLNAQGQVVDGTPIKDFYQARPAPEEYAGINLALNGVPFQTYTIPPAEGEGSARVSFLASLFDDKNQLQGILIGRTDLASNPLMLPVLSNLDSMTNVEGRGILLDGNRQVLYPVTETTALLGYQGEFGDQADYREDAAPDGTRRLVYYQPVRGSPWSIVMTVPARQAQQTALQIATPLLVMILLLFLLAAVFMRFALRGVTASLQNLAQEANRISSGQLDHPLLVDGEDEVGQLRRSFEHMRSSLKGRLDELKRLLVVSQGVASSLEIEDAIKPLLESALSTGACSARVVLSPEAIPEISSGFALATRFGAGPGMDLYSALDDQVLTLARQQERVALNNLTHVRMLNFPSGTPRPEALLALPLRHESLYYGTLWLAYESPHQFSEDEIRFMTTLAGQAALASSNARLFATAELGRQRLAAILASTPDPVLVTDHRNRLLLANPAAGQIFGLGVEAGEGMPISQVIQQNELITLMRTFSEEKLSAEVRLSDKRVYLATASSVLVDSRPVGRVCILRDVTHFKELDELKSEFVATVSHDLRSPLTLMRGYATMLEMVGDLNDQQTSYVRKIVAGVESMAHLVSTLLDLGRIEAGVDLQLEMVPVHDIVERVVSSMQLQASQKQITITTDISPKTIPLVEADHALLQQALHNLVENAIKYTETGGKVILRVGPEQERLVFEVSDTGIGIAPVDQAHLFEKFYRGGQKEARKRQGTGLGLAIVKSIAERHKGQVWVVSQLGKGSTFYFAIPFRQPRGEH